MAKSYLTEAFEELDLLDKGEFDFDKKGAEELAKFKEDDAFEDFETVIDPNAHSDDELQDSYIGMAILGCDVCHSMIYKAPEEVIIDEESQMANVGEPCPYCYETDGFKIIGKVAPFEEGSVEVTDKIEDEEKPEPTVKVDGKDVPIDEAPEKEEEALTAEQKYPVQSPIAESLENDDQDDDEEDSDKEDDSEELEEAKVTEGLSNREKLLRAFPELNFDRPMRESVENKLEEGMEDISITTDDQVIKVKATPRADKEEIEPITPAELEKAQEEAAPIDATTSEGEEEASTEGEEVDVELDEIDSESFDELGESYLKKVYDNVDSFKTTSAGLVENKLTLEGIIKFASGKKAKTQFLFEGKETTKKGKIKFIGENVNLSKNKRAFTLTGTATNGNLICEQLNYNYLAKDEKGASKRLYGTVRKSK